MSRIAAGSSIDCAIAVAERAVQDCAGRRPAAGLPGSRRRRPGAASRESMSTAIAAEPSTAPTWRVAL